MATDLHVLLPKVYDGILETDALMTAEEALFNTFFSNMTNCLDDTFLATADEEAVTAYENLLGIKKTSGETLAFRRQRLINRFSTSPPFTINFLKQRLDEIIGVSKYEVSVNPSTYTLYVYSSAENQNWFEEIIITINKIKPANIIFVNSPRISDDIAVSEVIKSGTLIYNYKLGVSWNLGAKPFLSSSNLEVIKLATTPSIQNNLLNHLSTFTASDIAKVKLNGTYTITTFTTKSATNNIVTVEYEVPTSSGLTSITQVQLLDSNNNVLTDSSVFVPLVENVQMQHKITTIEGV